MAKRKKKRDKRNEPRTQEVKDKIRDGMLAMKAQKIEDKRWAGLDIRTQLGETLFGRNGEKI